MRSLSRRAVMKAIGGLVAFVPAARLLAQPVTVAADEYCGCTIPEDCECDCPATYNEVVIPCELACGEPPYGDCTTPVLEVVQYACCNYIEIFCDATALVIARIPCNILDEP